MRLPSFRSSLKVPAVFVAGVLLGSVLITPAVGHIGSIAHTWKKHFRPLADKRYVQKAKVLTGRASCPAVTWQEATSSFGFGGSTNLRFVASPSASGRFFCNMALPHGARMKVARFTVHDASATENVACWVTRHGLNNSQATDLIEVQSGIGATPGTTVLTAGFSAAPVNNQTHSHAFECLITGNGADIGIRGASIVYEVTGAQGAAS